MSQAPGGKKGGKGPPKKNTEDDKSTAGKVTDDKDETSSVNGDKKEIKESNGDVPKPPSAGVNMREAAAKVLVLAQKTEWSAVENTLKVLEKLVAAGGEDAVTVPMAGIHDPTTGMTPLMYAVKDNRTSFVERLIELGSDVGARNNDNYNVLHISAMYSREDIVKLLLSKRGVDPFATGGSRQQTAVHLVASRQTGTATSILRALLTAAGKDIRLRADGRGKIPLLLAVEAGNQSMVRELLSAQTAEQLKASTPAGDTALHLAARRRDVDMARILVDYGAAIDATNEAGMTALHISAAEGDEPLVKYFYGVRANAAIADNEDRTPMHLAAENGHAAIIELLADKFKASIFERTKDGSTLMHIASLNGHADCAMMLFKKGVYLHMPNKDGARSIHTAARYGHVGIINTLLQKGESVDVTTNDNYTALHIAVESCKPAVVETLLGYGADVHIRGGKQRETPLHIAARIPEGDKCALMLLKSGAGPNKATEDGMTPVHVAARYGNLATLILLLEDGGDPLRKSKTGETPLHMACRSCQPDVVRHLIEFVKEHKGESIATSYLDAVDDDGASALHYACKIKKEEVKIPAADREVVKCLIENGADVTLITKHNHETAFHFCAIAGNNDVMTEMITHMSAADVGRALNKQNSVGWTPLLIACHRGHMELVSTLLSNHARVDVFDVEGRSALHLAAEHGYLQVCDALLTNKAFINSKARNGRTALHLAAMNGYAHLVKFLIRDHNAMIDVLTLKKQTPLHLAAASGQIEVCKLLLELGANIDATDELGQKPIHAAAQNNYSEVVQLFLQQHPNLVMATTKDGNTCAHIAAIQGSVKVIEELMKFDRTGVISARNKLNDSTPLQLAAEGGHADVVRVLVRAGASCTDENRAGLTAVHLAAEHGHTNVLDVMRSTNTLRISSKKLGLTPLHIAAYYGQAETVRELLSHVPGTVKSEAPTGVSLVPVLGSESGLTPLHLAAYNGNENVVRLLLNSAGVQVDAASTENGYNPLHLACFGGHMSIVGLLLSRSAELLQSTDRHGKTGLHIASTHGHYQMVEVLLGQGAEINATDKNGWTPLHCAAKAGHLNVVKLLCESGASPKSETNLNCAPIWFAASENHNDVLEYLLHKEHDTQSLMDDKRFVYNLMVCSKNHNNLPIEEFVLVSPAPVDTAAKLSNIYIILSTKEKERAKDLIAAGKQCEAMATELLALAAGADSAGHILTATDNRNIEFLDVLIENEQKEVIAHTVVQRYLQELWRGSLKWTGIKIMFLFFAFIICPPVWMVFSLPILKYNKVPIIKFMSYLTSHIYLMILLALVAITPIYNSIFRESLVPRWYEWMLLIWLSGLLLFELTNPSDKSGLGWIKIAVLLLGMIGVATHVVGWIFVEKKYWPTLMYCRNQCFALSFLLACVQILDFLSFHHLFGPWAIIIGDLMKDLGRFLAVLAIFVFGFSMHIVALNQPFRNIVKPEDAKIARTARRKLFSDVTMNPLFSFELLFFAVFGQTTTEQTRVHRNDSNVQPLWTNYLFKIVFGIYMLVSVVVLINLLIAMMSDTYQRIQAQSDIEWKYGLSKLIRNMHRTTTAPSPLNLVTTWLMWLIHKCKGRITKKKRPSLVHMIGLQRQDQMSARTKAGAKWLSKVKRGQVVPKDSTRLSVVHLSPLGSQMSFNNMTRIENVVDWEIIAKKYRALMRDEPEEPVLKDTDAEEADNTSEVVPNNVAAPP
ncbi:serine/threonine-protein phosphatase 6 regulatory ankyrin repeat subunit B isoform X1 [Leguminivora glycinivorella]|uniref:serine/threonine-protein phosphatase 6 regulatory ankyrin repeat subunit B isoform X1 n=1 Tax=Leguminivora glycinivorella TaxID=1035111 RepID=UPI00200D53AA|nr:serine/threonine-protein phosphatase 6 regulatory ankyrin repeat subunit B isoform X1 [Leguminivora glycinivorella]